ncbi:putative nucleic acid-binding Zn-ribbon protein [Luteibacter jiangsuensis]|uniref:Nucleic acid-binding Zn-ribbon protein n=1 Tax=Luteibacter jiangsuensis TaxID=637577 RepID=A0ABT9STV3_9GAMM|nr:hypothetical protein [Luteibacter jiangsuensis]MDQ0008433.1 putative nucleic acid-binding Zn-ribbon protein [Luteibacter jiangsuensis]
MTFDAKKHSRSVPLMCPTCGGTEFEHAEDVTASDASVRCARCGLELTKDELIRANQENLSMHAKEVAEGAAKDLTQELRDTLRRAFSGSKNIRIK